MKLESLITLAALGAAAFIVASGAKARTTATATKPTAQYTGGFLLPSIGGFGGDPANIWTGTVSGWNLQPISLANPYGTASFGL